MLEVIQKVTRCQQVYIVSYSLIKSYFSDEHISTFNRSTESRPHSSKSVQLAWLVSFFSKQFQNTVPNSARMHNLASLLSKFSKQFRLRKHRFIQHHNAPFSFLAFTFFSAVPTSKPPFQIASECTSFSLCFPNFLSSSNFLKIIQIAPECTVLCSYF